MPEPQLQLFQRETIQIFRATITRPARQRYHWVTNPTRSYIAKMSPGIERAWPTMRLILLRAKHLSGYWQKKKQNFRTIPVSAKENAACRRAYRSILIDPSTWG